MPGFDKVCMYRTVDSTDKENGGNSPCQSQPDCAYKIQGMCFHY